MKNYFTLLLLTSSLALFAQKGKIRGTLIDDITGEPVPFANVAALQNGNIVTGASTDFDGKYAISVDAGVYDVKASFVSYADKSVQGVEVKADEVTIIDIRMQSADLELEEVVISVKQIRNTESALQTIKKKSVNVLDGISSQTFKKIGDGDAAAAVKRVPGVSIQDGKYVFVRGLGDRYTKTQLHSLDIPGLDPDRNSLQIDIFPTNIIDNIIVLKSFTADLPADFTGGIVNIETKEFPEEPTLNASVGVSYTPGMHFNNEFLTQDKGGTDFLGYDNGLRDEPLLMGVDNREPTGSVALPQDVNQTTEKTSAFEKNLGAGEKTSFMNYSAGISGGNQIDRDKVTYGYSGALSYKNNTKFYQNREQNFYRKTASDSSIYSLRDEVLQTGELGISDIFTSVMLGGAMKTKKLKLKLNFMNLQNGEARSGQYKTENLIISNNESKRDNLEYSERSIMNVLLSTEYNIDENWKIELKLSPTRSKIEDKDVRSTGYLANPDGTFLIDPSEVASPSRLWRNLTETNIAGRLDIFNDHRLFGYEAKLRGGIGYVSKNRSYEILGYNLLVQGSLEYTGDADELLSDDFIWTSDKGVGTFMFGNYQRSNTYEGEQVTISTYLSEQFQFTKNLKVIAGIRAEKYTQDYIGQNQAANVDTSATNATVFSEARGNTRILDSLRFFPTVSLIYQVNENSNFRLAYFKTIARPSFKEKSTAEIADPLSGLTYIGNIDLIPTDIYNVDLRYEYFFEDNQTVSLSGFYKTFRNPIELTSYSQSVRSFQHRNVGDARVLGVELESKFNLGNLSARLTHFSIKTNISIIDSRVKFDTSANGTFQGKLNGLRAGEELGEYRDMQGQAPYIVNAGLIYSNRDRGIDAGLYYNVQGPKLVIVGINLSPDVYSVPFHSLNLNFLKKFGKDDQYQVGVGVNNITGDLREEVTRSYKAEDKIFSRYNPGTNLSLSFSYAIR